MCVRMWDQVIVHGYRQVIYQMMRELFTFHWIQYFTNEELNKYNVCVCVCIPSHTYKWFQRIILLVNEVTKVLKVQTKSLPIYFRLSKCALNGNTHKSIKMSNK